jgi:diadenosine tetraphosphate (Ap4A) HIT family hydrolase
MSLIGSIALACRHHWINPTRRRHRASTATRRATTAEQHDCPFCPECLDHSTDAHDERLFSDRLIDVLPDLSPLCPGHLLAVSRRHVLSMAELGSPALADLAKTLSRLRADLSPEFGDYFLFEHGTPPGGGSHGACIDHAHIHMLPMESRMFDRLTEALPWESISCFEELARYKQVGYAYLGIKGSCYVCPNPDTGSQWLRRQVCAALGRDDWDWALAQSHVELRLTIEGSRRMLSESHRSFPCLPRFLRA